MTLPRGVSASRVVRALENLGYRVVRQCGSHLRLKHTGPPAHSITGIDPKTEAPHLRKFSHFSKLEKSSSSIWFAAATLSSAMYSQISSMLSRAAG